MNAFLTDKLAEIFQAMGAKQVVKEYRKRRISGAIMGTEPGTQSIPAMLGLFVTGVSALGESVDQNVMTAGAAIFQDLWSACHRQDGQGVPQLFPRLSHAAKNS